uniref:Reverse transcriptase domain-containing protein n=1 Tax=Photinus pyralis TaxID=7054 RepID=A0A1Y1K185_PHOPY
MENMRYIDDPLEVANLFNNHFRNAPLDTIHSIKNNDPTTLSTNTNQRTMYLYPFCEQELIQLINNKIKSKRSAGPDDFPCFLVRIISHVIVRPLTYLINLSFLTGAFPEALKLAKIIPVHKKGNKYTPNNFRPISITSVFTKIFEYCFLDRLERFIEKCKILIPNQFGFRPNKSTTDAILFFYDTVLQSIGKKELPIGIYCDITKAFDCANHNLLLQKLSRYGVRGTALNWLEKFLKNRTQYVSLRHSNKGYTTNVNSDIIKLNVGTPQGSILAPILFTLFTNDVLSCIPVDATLSLYADDTAVVVSHPDENELRATCILTIENLSRWFENNLLFLNHSKTKFLQFHNYQNTNTLDINISVNDANLEKSTTVKFLGVVLDDTLSWISHNENLIKQLNTECYRVRYLRYYLDVKQLRMFYFACIESRLRYGLCLWGRSSTFNQVFVTQKRIVRCTCGANYTQPCRPIFTKLRILPLPYLYILEVCKIIFKNKHQLPHNCDIHKYHTRNTNDLRVPRGRTNVNQSSPYIIGAKIFNSLPFPLKRPTTSIRSNVI